MYMNVFNELNSRKLGDKELNILSGMHYNPLYIVIVLFELGVIWIMTHKDPIVFSIA